MGRGIPLSVYGRLASGSYRSRPLIHGSFRKAPLPKECQIDGSISRDTSVPAAEDASSDTRVALHPLLRLALLRSRSIRKLNSIQESAFLSILTGKDVTIHAPIGSGKTLSYLLPIVNNIYNIHDLLENLQLSHRNTGNSDKEEKLLLTSLGYTRTVPHALVPTSMKDLLQDGKVLHDRGIEAKESGSTVEKLVELLHKVDPKQLKRRYVDLPSIPRTLWGRKSRNAIYRALMANPLGTVRCCVIVVPNKDLVAHVMKELSLIDPLGRLSVQTLSQVHHVPHQPNEGNNTEEPSGEQPFYPSHHALQYISNTPGRIQLSLEDEREMLRSIPIEPVAETSVETVPVNRGAKRGSVLKSPSSIAMYKEITKKALSNDGFVARSVEYVKRPVINYPVIQYGSVDIVITTAQLFLNDLLSNRKMSVVPACVIFDEVDFLFENNATRRAMMEICSILRPRPPLFNPLVHDRKPRRRGLAPCQFIHVSSTMNYSGMQTTGSMLFERFTTSNMITTSRNHYLSDHNAVFLNVEEALESKTKRLMEVLLDSPFAKTIVYAESLKELRTLYKLLKEKDWPVLSFHGRSTLATRLALLETFKTEEVAILICTDLLARGIEAPANHIINFSFPKNAATYLHRIKGIPERVTNFVLPENGPLAAEIAKVCSMNIPVNHILSRKRSLRNRRVNMLKGGKGIRRPGRASIKAGKSTEGARTMKPSVAALGTVTPDGGISSSHVSSKYSGLLTNEGEFPVEIDICGTSKEAQGTRYRRRSFKSRGLDLYNNFSDL